MTETKLLIIFVDEMDRWGEQPLYQAIVNRLVDSEVAGATALPGLVGYGAHAALTRTRPMGTSDDRPVAIFSVDTEDKFREVMPAIRPMVREGMIFMTDAELLGPAARPM